MVDVLISQKNLLGLFFVLGLSACTSTGTPVLRSTSGHPEVVPDSVQQQLMDVVQQWYGTPHSDRSAQGIDCSAFVQRTYRDLFDLNLPRTTAGQVKVGVKVPRKELHVGDLVFFRPSQRTRHVGFYVGDGAFAHVSSSRGVMISRLNEPYWSKRYWTARRVFTTPEVNEEPRVTSPRFGW